MAVVKRESKTVRFMVSEELFEALRSQYSSDYPGQWSDGLKAFLYEEMGVEPPRELTELEKAELEMERLRVKMEELKKSEKVVKSDSPAPAKKG